MIETLTENEILQKQKMELEHFQQQEQQQEEYNTYQQNNLNLQNQYVLKQEENYIQPQQEIIYENKSVKTGQFAKQILLEQQKQILLKNQMKEQAPKNQAQEDQEDEDISDDLDTHYISSSQSSLISQENSYQNKQQQNNGNNSQKELNIYQQQERGCKRVKKIMESIYLQNRYIDIEQLKCRIEYICEKQNLENYKKEGILTQWFKKIQKAYSIERTHFRREDKQQVVETLLGQVLENPNESFRYYQKQLLNLGLPQQSQRTLKRDLQKAKRLVKSGQLTSRDQIQEACQKLCSNRKTIMSTSLLDTIKQYIFENNLQDKYTKREFLEMAKNDFGLELQKNSKIISTYFRDCYKLKETKKNKELELQGKQDPGNFVVQTDMGLSFQDFATAQCEKLYDFWPIETEIEFLEEEQKKQLNDKYYQSPYTLYEIHELLQQAKLDQENRKKGIIPTKNYIQYQQFPQYQSQYIPPNQQQFVFPQMLQQQDSYNSNVMTKQEDVENFDRPQFNNFMPQPQPQFQQFQQQQQLIQQPPIIPPIISPAPSIEQQNLEQQNQTPNLQNEQLSGLRKRAVSENLLEEDQKSQDQQNSKNIVQNYTKDIQDQQISEKSSQTNTEQPKQQNNQVMIEENKENNYQNQNQIQKSDEQTLQRDPPIRKQQMIQQYEIQQQDQQSWQPLNQTMNTNIKGPSYFIEQLKRKEFIIKQKDQLIQSLYLDIEHKSKIIQYYSFQIQHGDLFKQDEKIYKDFYYKHYYEFFEKLDAILKEKQQILKEQNRQLEYENFCNQHYQNPEFDMEKDFKFPTIPQIKFYQQALYKNFPDQMKQLQDKQQNGDQNHILKFLNGNQQKPFQPQQALQMQKPEILIQKENFQKFSNNNNKNQFHNINFIKQNSINLHKEISYEKINQNIIDKNNNNSLEKKDYLANVKQHDKTIVNNSVNQDIQIQKINSQQKNQFQDLNLQKSYQNPDKINILQNKQTFQPMNNLNNGIIKDFPNFLQPSNLLRKSKSQIDREYKENKEKYQKDLDEFGKRQEKNNELLDLEKLQQNGLSNINFDFSKSAEENLQILMKIQDKQLRKSVINKDKKNNVKRTYYEQMKDLDKQKEEQYKLKYKQLQFYKVKNYEGYVPHKQYHFQEYLFKGKEDKLQELQNFNNQQYFQMQNQQIPYLQQQQDLQIQQQQKDYNNNQQQPIQIQQNQLQKNDSNNINNQNLPGIQQQEKIQQQEEDDSSEVYDQFQGNNLQIQKQSIKQNIYGDLFKQLKQNNSGPDSQNNQLQQNKLDKIQETNIGNEKLQIQQNIKVEHKEIQQISDEDEDNIIEQQKRKQQKQANKNQILEQLKQQANYQQAKQLQEEKMLQKQTQKQLKQNIEEKQQQQQQRNQIQKNSLEKNNNEKEIEIETQEQQQQDEEQIDLEIKPEQDPKQNIQEQQEKQVQNYCQSQQQLQQENIKQKQDMEKEQQQILDDIQNNQQKEQQENSNNIDQEQIDQINKKNINQSDEQNNYQNKENGIAQSLEDKQSEYSEIEVEISNTD